MPAVSRAGTVQKPLGAYGAWFIAAPGEVNQLTIVGGGLFHDAGAPVTAGVGCTQIDANTATCPARYAYAELGDENDVAWLTDGDAGVNGGPGDDLIVGSHFADAELGGDGNDVLIGGRGADELDGGNGDDRIYAFDGVRDSIDCGAGTDTLSHDLYDQPRYGCERSLLSH